MDHPFKTSAFLRRGGVKNWPNMSTDDSKKTAKGSKIVKICRRLYWIVPLSLLLSCNFRSENISKAVKLFFFEA